MSESKADAFNEPSTSPMAEIRAFMHMFVITNICIFPAIAWWQGGISFEVVAVVYLAFITVSLTYSIVFQMEGSE